METSTHFHTLRPDHTLGTFVKAEYPGLPIVDPDGAIVGFVRQEQVISESIVPRYMERSRRDTR